MAASLHVTLTINQLCSKFRNSSTSANAMDLRSNSLKSERKFCRMTHNILISILPGHFFRSNDDSNKNSLDESYCEGRPNR